MSKKYTGIVISDIHVGALSLDKLYNEYHEIFINYIKKMKSLDFLIIDGDFFDHKFFLNDKESIVAYKMMVELLDVCRLYQTKIRIVYGTESHECNQYDILSLLDIYPDIKVIKYAEEETLFDDMRVLYLPEEHLTNANEYYKKFFDKTKNYNYIFGHGVIREVMKDAAVQMENKTSTESKRKKVPIFTTSQFRKCCKGQTFFGHYHINQNINDDVFYVGSFSRWCFGEEEPKGFYQIDYDVKSNTYDAIFIENTMADSYVTIGYGYEDKVFDSIEDMDKSLSSVDKLISNNVFDHVRFEFNIPDNVENPEATMNYLKERYKFNDKIKLNIVHGYIEEKKKQQKEIIKKENEKYSFIFDKSLDLENKVSQFISIEYHKDIPSDSTSKYLFLPLNQILEELDDK